MIHNTQNDEAHLPPRLVDLGDTDPFPGSRPLHSKTVGLLAESIREFGLLYPPTMIAAGARYLVFDGLHRCAAQQLNGATQTMAFVLPEGTDPKTLRVRSLHANHVRKDETFADVLDRIEGLMQEHKCGLREATQIAKIKGPYASKLIKTVEELSPEALSIVRSTPSVGPTIAYHIAKQTRNSEKQLHWLREYIAGRMSRSDIIAQGSSSSSKTEKRVSLKVNIDEVVFQVSMPAAIAYDRLGKCVGKLKQRFSEQQKLNHPVDLLPRLMK